MGEKFMASVLARQDVRELLAVLADFNVRYLIFGGCAVMLYSGCRYTGNVDIWSAHDPTNALAIFSALEAFGAPLAGLDAADFSKPGHFYQMGSPPVRIDDMLSTCGVFFMEAWPERETIKIDGMDVPFIGKRHLIETKLAAGRPQDIVDVRILFNAGRSVK